MKIFNIYMVLCFILGAQADALDFGVELNKALHENVQKQIADNPGSAANVVSGMLGTTQEEEIAIGRQIAGNLLGASPLVKDDRLQKYVNEVGRWVASQSERPDLPWHFGVIDTGDINAFASPGGYVFVTRGLYMQLQNEAQLAGVLGHEIGHVIRKHHLKILQQSSLIDLGGQALARSAGENDKIKQLIGSGAEIMSRSLDKNAEFEADGIAVVLSGRAGYDPFSFAEVLQGLSRIAKDSNSVELLFKTHPLPEARLEKLSAAMGDKLDNIKGLTLDRRFYRLRQ
jgi:beta-barrel assembly-enhancing protease